MGFEPTTLRDLVVIWLVLVQDSVVIKTVNEDLRLSSSPSVPSIAGECIEGSYQNDGYG